MNLFVYGTLLPGESRWHVLEPYVEGQPAKAEIVGSLFDMGSYPALILDHPYIPAGAVHGVVCKIRDGAEQTVTRILDRIEGYTPGGNNNLYERVEAVVYIPQAMTEEQITASFYVGGEWIAEECTERNHIKSGSWRNR